MHEILLAGCSDQQESNDVAFPEGAQGAFRFRAASDRSSEVSDQPRR